MHRLLALALVAIAAALPLQPAEAAKPLEAHIVSGPDGGTADVTPTFRFRAKSAAVFTCRLDRKKAKQCSSPKTLRTVPDGQHTLTVIAYDRSGHHGRPAHRTFVVDSHPPDTNVVSGPGVVVASGVAVFTFASSEAGSSFECRLDDGPLASCGSPSTFTGLADGPHLLLVRACDAVGNCDPTPALRPWAVDTLPPDTSIDAGPTEGVNTSSNDPSFTFSADPAGGSTFECSLDGPSFTACVSPRTFTDVGDGQHAFAVRACDAVGNCDPTPATRTWVIDTVPPDTSIDDGPTADVTTSSNDPSFTFSADPAGGSTFECSLDGPTFTVCDSPELYLDVADGLHTFAVRACDAVTNCDSTPASRTWTVDANAPDTQITSGPSGPTIRTSATFTYTGTPEGDAVGFECQLDFGLFAACFSSGQSYGFVSASFVHTFRVRACDALHQCDPSPPIRTWTSVPSGATPNNETDAAAEAGFCNLQFPQDTTAAPGVFVNVFGRIFEAGVTTPAGASAQVIAQVGLGPAGTDPRSNGAWSWTDAFFHAQVDDHDEYQGGFSAPGNPGTYSYATRFSLDDSTVTYCDKDGAGSNSGFDFSTASMGVLTVP